MPKKKTHEEFIKQMQEINSNIQILGEYIANSVNIECKCLLDGYVWSPRPSDLIQGKGCHKCKSKIISNAKTSKAKSEFLEKLKVKNKNFENIELLTEYTRAKDKIKCKCKIDNFIWETTADSLLKGTGCPICSNRNVNKINGCLKSHEKFILEMKEINPNIMIIGKYKNAITKIQCKCLLCGFIWKENPNSLLSKQNGCKECNLKNESKLEKETKKCLDNLFINYESQKRFKDCKNKYSLPFDFYLPKYNCCIEVDGEQHYKSVEYFGGEKTFKETKFRDNIKNEYCKNNNKKLIRIPYWDIKNIEDILKKELNLINKIK